jgi:hypothetical protein
MNESKKSAEPVLGATHRDRAVALFQGALGGIPFVGSIIAEVVGQLIPEQRMERLEAYARLLGERLPNVEQDDLRNRFRDPENIDLFEEGAVQAARALSEERRAYLAAVVARGISGDERVRLEAKRLLALLREIDDSQVICLASHLSKNWGDEEFRKRHQLVLEPNVATLRSDQATVDAGALKDAAVGHLIRLDLLRPRFNRVRSNTPPEFDENTGTLKSSGAGLTSLGRILLRAVDLAGPEDY